MKLIDDFTNLERVISIVEANTLTENDYQKLKKISTLIKKHVEIRLQGSINESNFTRFYLEYIIRNSNTPIDKLEKEIIIANAILPDDIEVAELLNQNGFTIEELKNILRFRVVLKNIVLNNSITNKEIETQFEEYKKTIIKLTNIFKAKYNLDNQTVILNRICEIIVTHPNYFETKSMSKTKIR